MNAFYNSIFISEFGILPHHLLSKGFLDRVVCSLSSFTFESVYLLHLPKDTWLAIQFLGYLCLC
jgi:hypothetical protein